MTSILPISEKGKKAALSYLERGWSPIPVPRGEKNPGRRGWQDESLDADGIEREFCKPQNIGVLLGEPSGGLLDVDLDSPAAVKLARRFLPTPNDAVFGRKSRRRSHWLYKCTRPGRTKRFGWPRPYESVRPRVRFSLARTRDANRSANMLV